MQYYFSTFLGPDNLVLGYISQKLLRPVWHQISQDETISFVCVLFASQVKEKETARKEYKKAIEKGHGAYLMDQDAPVCPP